MAQLFPGDRKRGTRKTTRNDVNPAERGRIEIANVGTNYIPLWAVLLKSLASVTVELDESDVFDPGLLQAQGLTAATSA
jgi:hypothetical protein